MEKGKIFAVTGFNQNNGLSVGVQADTREEFESIVNELRTYAARDAVIAQLFAPVVGIVQTQGGSLPPVTQGPDEAQALANLQQAGLVSTVGQPLPQPTVTATPAAVPATPQATTPAGGAASAPPGVAYPGDCPHGPRVYVDKMAKGKPWRRWECATPWKPGMTKAERDARCAPTNVES